MIYVSIAMVRRTLAYHAADETRLCAITSNAYDKQHYPRLRAAWAARLELDDVLLSPRLCRGNCKRSLYVTARGVLTKLSIEVDDRHPVLARS